LRDSPLRRVLVVLGTRPDTIKLAPVIDELRRRKDAFRVEVCSTGQHAHLLEQALKACAIAPDCEIRTMEDDQDLSGLTCRILSGLQPIIDRGRHSVVIVQGDTATAFGAALAAYHARTPVAHVEAGLRTAEKYNPFPEEIYRRLISSLADLHFAPTALARENLLCQGGAPERVFVTGNTVVDSLQRIVRRWNAGHNQGVAEAVSLMGRLRQAGARRLILVTCHRRESFGADLQEICTALRQVARYAPDLAIVFPVHANPKVNGPVRDALAGTRGVHLIDPLPYEAFLYLLRESTLVLTDSGGVQEEAPSFGKPVLVMRRVTERIECVQRGFAQLVGVSAEDIAAAALRLLTDSEAYARMRPAANPYGDGRAAVRIANILEEHI